MNAGGHLEVFARGTDGTLHSWWQRHGDTWSDCHHFGHPLTGDPVVEKDNNGQLVLFAKGPDNALHYMAQKPTGGWTDWRTLAVPTA